MNGPSGLCCTAGLLVVMGLAGCESDGTPTEEPRETEASLAGYRAGPAPRTEVAFVRPAGVEGHIAVPVSVNGGPERAFILDTGAPVTTVMVSEALLELGVVRGRWRRRRRLRSGGSLARRPRGMRGRRGRSRWGRRGCASFRTW